MSRLSRSLLLAAALACAVGSSILWVLYLALYWPYRGLFNEEGRYLDEATSVVHHAQTGLLAAPALALALLALGLARAWWIRRGHGHAGGPA